MKRSTTTFYIFFTITLVSSALILLSALVTLKTIAADTYSARSLQVTVNNNAPTIDNSVTISESAADTTKSTKSINLIEGAYKSIWIHGKVNDLNGKNDLRNVKITFFDTNTLHNQKKADCTPDNSDNCYQVSLNISKIECVNESKTSCTFLAEIPLSFHTSPSIYTVSVIVSDQQNANSSPTESEPIQINSLLAIDAATSIDYGVSSAGDTAQASLRISNLGNITSNLLIATTPLTCEQGAIPENLISFNGVPLSGKELSYLSYDLQKQTGTIDNGSTTTLMLLGPINSKAHGYCEGALSLTATTAE